MTSDPDLHLVVDGVVSRPSMVTGLAHVFRLTLPAQEVRLVSRAVRPAEISGSIDTRLLGFSVCGLRLQQGQWTFDIQPGEPELVDGFHDFEVQGWRWTNGDAGLPHATFASVGGPFLFIVFGWGAPEYALPDSEGREDERLFFGFESLGGDCEFAFAQRHYDAEPMGLLRWANISAATLQTCLDQRFDGLGELANTDLVWSPIEREYQLVDRTGFRAHTWITEKCPDPAEEARIKRYGCMQLRLLRRKLVSDIEHAKKIFVFKTEDPNFGLPEQRRMHRALRRIGPSSLLCVQRAGPGDTAGQASAADEGLFVGHVDRFVLAEGPYEMWRSLCLQARALHSRQWHLRLRHHSVRAVTSRVA